MNTQSKKTRAKTETRKIKIAVCDEQGVILDAGTFEIPKDIQTVSMKWLPKGVSDVWGDAEFDLGK